MLFGQIFNRIARNYSRYVPSDELTSLCESHEAVYAHKYTINELIRPLGLTIQCRRNCGYTLVELSSSTGTSRPRRRSRR